MAITRNSAKNNSDGSNNNGTTWWMNIEGIKAGTSVAFNLSQPFKDATQEEVLKILQTAEVYISCFNKVSVKMRGQYERGTYVWGHINNFDHGLSVDCDPKDKSETEWAIKAQLEALEIGDISTAITAQEASGLLAAL